MNKSQQAKDGFKTFIITLSFSLVVFSAIYYIFTGSQKKPGIEEDTLSTTDSRVLSSQTSVFEKMSEEKLDVKSPAVLSGAGTFPEATQSTVPATGSNMPVSLILSLGALTFSAYILILGPQKFALRDFEERTTKRP